MSLEVIFPPLKLSSSLRGFSFFLAPFSMYSTANVFPASRLSFSCPGTERGKRKMAARRMVFIILFFSRRLAIHFIKIEEHLIRVFKHDFHSGEKIFQRHKHSVSVLKSGIGFVYFAF